MQPAIYIATDDQPDEAAEQLRAALAAGFRRFALGCRAASLTDVAERAYLGELRALLPDACEWLGLALTGQTDEPAQAIAAGIQSARAQGAQALTFKPEPAEAARGALSGSHYERAYAAWLHRLVELRHAAEAHTVELLAIVGSRGFLTSPLEVRTLIDQVNSAYVGVALDVERAACLADPADWVHILGHRLRAIELDMSDASADRANVVAALRATQFAGPIIATRATGFDDSFAALARIAAE